MTDVDSDRIEQLDDFLRRMIAADRDLSHAVIRPKDAATLILVDRSGPVPKVLLGKRHPGSSSCRASSFFPAAGLDPTDQAMPIATPLDPQRKCS